MGIVILVRRGNVRFVMVKPINRTFRTGVVRARPNTQRNRGESLLRMGTLNTGRGMNEAPIKRLTDGAITIGLMQTRTMQPHTFSFLTSSFDGLSNIGSRLGRSARELRKRCRERRRSSRASFSRLSEPDGLCRESSNFSSPLSVQWKHHQTSLVDPRREKSGPSVEKA